MIFWWKKSLEPRFTITQFTEHLESVGYEIISSKKGVPMRERIKIIDNEAALTLDNVEVLVSIDDELRARLSV